MFSYPVIQNRILFSTRRCILHPVLTVLSIVHPSPHVLTLFRKHSLCWYGRNRTAFWRNVHLSWCW
jgi:hypothetical protein